MVNRITQPINWGDLLRDTMHLSPTIFGAYVRLIGHYWVHGGLPDNDTALRRITGLHNNFRWRAQRAVLQEFFYDGWKHKRIDADLVRQAKFRDEQKQKAGQRWPVDNSVSKVVCDRPTMAAEKSFKNNGPPQIRVSLPYKERKNTLTSSLNSVPREAEKHFKNLNGEASPAGHPSPGPEMRNFRKAEHQAKKDARRLKARQAWEADLVRQLGANAYATAIEILAEHPELADRATEAELRKPGSGTTAAVIGMQRHLRGAA